MCTGWGGGDFGKVRTEFLGAYAKIFRKATASCLSVRLSERKNSVPIGRIFMKLNIFNILLQSVEKIQVSLKSCKNKEYLT